MSRWLCSLIVASSVISKWRLSTWYERTKAIYCALTILSARLLCAMPML